MSRCYLYVVDRDFGFAPNPFHGVCTLATCKPQIRARGRVGDWVVGMGGRRLKATGRCVFAMRVTCAVSFDEYWQDPKFRDKQPVRNGSSTMMVGDNIYHRGAYGRWLQADSHHSNPDGTPNLHNVEGDTSADRVLISKYFYYFGKEAPLVPEAILQAMRYRNNRGYRVYDDADYANLVAWLESEYRHCRNTVVADPYDFDNSSKRYSSSDNKLR